MKGRIGRGKASLISIDEDFAEHTVRRECVKRWLLPQDRLSVFGRLAKASF